MANIDKIKERILQLRNMIPDRGATEAEAMTALLKADELMEKYGISEAELDTAEAKRDMRPGEFKHKQKAEHPSSKYCGNTIATFCGVRNWYSPRDRMAKAFGFKADVEMFEFLSELIHNAMDRGWKDFLATNPKEPGVSRHTQYWSFMIGFAERINEKLMELIHARMEAQEVKGTGTDLVEKKMAVVEAAMAEMLPDLKLKSTRNRGVRANMGALAQGMAAGDKVNLNRPIKSGPTTGRKALTG